MIQIMESGKGRVDGLVELMPAIQKSAAEIMQDARYQALNEDGKNPLAIDRLTRDGPRDLVGEAQEFLKSGPLYDLSKAPKTEQGLIL
mmetsp:Transcript_25700/g.32020  ORF Transcript_25700/g.32020 Transcript_25700/m.32020 type:complete len:88 (+) Transcript_25700:29-292(+)